MRRIAARSSKDRSRQAGAAAIAASTAAAASAFVAPRDHAEHLAVGVRLAHLDPRPLAGHPGPADGVRQLVLASPRARRAPPRAPPARGCRGRSRGRSRWSGWGRGSQRPCGGAPRFGSRRRDGPTLAPSLRPGATSRPGAGPPGALLGQPPSTRPRTSASSVTSYQSRSVGSVAPGSSSTWNDTMRRRSTGADSSTRDAVSGGGRVHHRRRVDVGGRDDAPHRAAGRPGHGLLAGREPGEVLELLLVGDQARTAQGRRHGVGGTRGPGRAVGPRREPARSSAVRAR